MKQTNILIILVLFYDTMQEQESQKLSIDGRIIEGVEVKPDTYKFLASIMYNGFHICGGSVVSPVFVLTAAHCCYDNKDNILKNSYMEASLGSIHYRNGTKYNVKLKYIHGGFNKDTMENDIAMIKLTEQIVFGRHISTVPLLRTELADEKENITAMVIGWGYESKDGKLVAVASEELMQVELTTMPWYMCKNYFQYVYKSQLCLSGPGRKGSCNGDSGGPLVTTIQQTVYQIGLVSYGSDCNNTAPEVYTRISHFYPWIKYLLLL